MDVSFSIDPIEFQQGKRRRIASLNTAPAPPKPAPTSAPGVHEIATFLPGRLEFEHELDNEAEDLVKDLEFGICSQWGGDAIPEDENDVDVKGRAKWDEERRNGGKAVVEIRPSPTGGGDAKAGLVNGKTPRLNGNGKTAPPNGHQGKSKNDDNSAENGSTGEGDGNVDEVTQPLPLETEESLKFKLTLLEMYSQRVDKRREAKAIIFDRGLLEYKKVGFETYPFRVHSTWRQMQAIEKKRPKEDKEIVHRLKPFAKIQTAEDFEVFSMDIVCTSAIM
jgi:transcriptional adapter 2-alpha